MSKSTVIVIFRLIPVRSVKGDMSMVTRFRSERDYAFGQAMFTLRTAIGLTQEGLGNRLGVSRRAVGKWEVGNGYPKPKHLKELLLLAVKSQAFTAGNEDEE